MLVKAFTDTHEIILSEIVYTANSLGLLGHRLEQLVVSGPCLWLDPPSVVNKLVAKVVVNVSVGRYQVSYFEAIALNIFFQRLLFRLIIGAAIDNNTFLGLVAHHVGIFPDRVAYESLDIQHLVSYITLKNTVIIICIVGNVSKLADRPRFSPQTISRQRSLK